MNTKEIMAEHSKKKNTRLEKLETQLEITIKYLTHSLCGKHKNE